MKNIRFTGAMLLIFCLLISFHAEAALSKLSLQQAIRTNAIIFNATGTGGAIGKCLTLHMKNISCRTIIIKMDQALIFRPSKLQYQDLVAVGGDSVQLAPDKSTELKVQTFCGKSPAASPIYGLSYTLLKQGDKAMIEVMDYIRVHKIYNYVGQHAVWTFTNNHCINTIYNPLQAEQSKNLMEYVAKVRQLPIPDYYTYYEVRDRPGAAMLGENPRKQYVDMSWGNEGYRNMTITVYKENGDVYKSGINSEHAGANGHTGTISFDPETEEGHYYVKLQDDRHRIWKVKEIFVGKEPCKM